MTHTDVPTFLTIIGENLKHYRKQEQKDINYPKVHPMSLTGPMTQAVLAKRADLSIPAIRNLENGKGTIDSLKRYMDEIELVLEIYYPLNKEEMEKIVTKSGSGKPYLRIGAQIKLLRQQKGYSQRKLAELVKVSHPTIVALELRDEGKLSTLEVISKVLSATVYVNSMYSMELDFDFHYNH